MTMITGERSESESAALDVTASQVQSEQSLKSQKSQGEVPSPRGEVKLCPVVLDTCMGACVRMSVGFPALRMG